MSKSKKREDNIQNFDYVQTKLTNDNYAGFPQLSAKLLGFILSVQYIFLKMSTLLTGFQIA